MGKLTYKHLHPPLPPTHLPVPLPPASLSDLGFQRRGDAQGWLMQSQTKEALFSPAPRAEVEKGIKEQTNVAPHAR